MNSQVKSKSKNQIKQELYEEHYELLKLIFLVGNKVAMQKQLRILMNKLNIDRYNQKHKINNVIKELEDAKLIERTIYEKTDNKIISLKDFAISRIANRLEEECDFAFEYNDSTVTKRNRTNNRIRLSVFKFEQLITLCEDRKFLNKNKIKTIDDLIRYVTLETSMTFQKHKGFEYFATFSRRYKERLYLQDNEIYITLKELDELRDGREESVPDKSGCTKDKAKEKKNKTKNGEKLSEGSSVRSTNKNKINNNHNAFLERKSVLSIGSIHDRISPAKGTKIEGIQQFINFRMDTYDINGTMDAESLGNRIKKTYSLLKNLYGGKDYLLDIERCKKCEHYEKACMNSSVDDDKVGRTYIKRIVNCPAKPKQLYRVVKLKVYVHMYNRKDVIDLKDDCGSCGQHVTGEKKKENRLLTELYTGNYVTRFDFENNIEIEFINLDLESKYLEGNKRENLNPHNKKKKDNANANKILDRLDTNNKNIDGIINVVDSLKLLSNEQLNRLAQNINKFVDSEINEDI